jgi:hypothetical protein
MRSSFAPAGARCGANGVIACWGRGGDWRGGRGANLVPAMDTLPAVLPDDIGREHNDVRMVVTRLVKADKDGLAEGGWIVHASRALPESSPRSSARDAGFGTMCIKRYTV